MMIIILSLFVNIYKITFIKNYLQQYLKGSNLMTESNQSAPTIRDFVFQDAQERAFQITIKGLKEYQAEKKNIYSQKKQITLQEYQKKNKEKLVEKRIRRSTLINASRMEKMQARNNAILKIVGIAQYNLYANITKNKDEYKKLLKKLIIEGMIKLFQEKVYIRCLRRDEKLIKEILPQCKNNYQTLLASELGHQVNVDISIHESQYLIEREVHDSSKLKIGQLLNQFGQSEFIQKSEQDIKCFGGVILTTEDGLIICKNTIDARIELAYQKSLPYIREHLFN